MADYFTKVSLTVAMTAEQADWVRRVHDAAIARMTGGHDAEAPGSDIADAAKALAEFDSAGLDDLEYQAGAEPGLWLSGEQVNCDYLAALLQQFLIHADDERFVAFEFSLDCSRPITDAFGGGAYVVSKDNIDSTDTSSWVEETLKTFDIRRTAAAIEAAFAFEHGALDDAVHDAISEDASGINNSGTMEQIALLLAAGWSQADIEAIGSPVVEG